jgi:hypothetical protein
MSRFDWSDNEVVVVRSYGDIAIYINGHGTDIAIRQEDQFDTDEPVVIVPIDSAEKVANRILELAKAIREGDFEPIPQSQTAEPAQRPLALPAPVSNGNVRRAAVKGVA